MQSNLLPEVGDLLLQQGPQPLFYFLKPLLFLKGHSSDTVRPATIKHSCISLPSPPSPQWSLWTWKLLECAYHINKTEAHITTQWLWPFYIYYCTVMRNYCDLISKCMLTTSPFPPLLPPPDGRKFLDFQKLSRNGRWKLIGGNFTLRNSGQKAQKTPQKNVPGNTSTRKHKNRHF